MVRRTFGHTRDEVTGEENCTIRSSIHSLCSSPIIRMIKSRTMRWAGHVAYIAETRNAYKNLRGRNHLEDEDGRIY
jgi:hypothetical protein